MECFGSEVTLAKFFFIPNEYLKVKYIVISLRDSFGAPTSVKKTFRIKTSLAVMEPLKGFFRSEVTIAKLV